MGQGCRCGGGGVKTLASGDGLREAEHGRRTRERTHARTRGPHPLQDPNPEDPLNKDAAAKLQENARTFESYVQRSIQYGMQIDGTWFPPCAG